MNETGKVIHDLRCEAGYTQKFLAEALHVTTQAISKWERGISFPDVALLPKLSLLLDADINLLISRSIERDEWVGLIDILGLDFSQRVYDKPLVYFLLSHYLLLGIRKIYILTDEQNQRYLSTEHFASLGFRFFFKKPEEENAMILNHPWFLFGSDLTRQFQGAMVMEKSTQLVPESQNPVVFFYRHDDLKYYFKNKEYDRHGLSKRSLGRGMICFDMDNYDKVLDVASFIRTYQKNSGLLIGSLEEIALRQNILTAEQVTKMAEILPYGDLLKKAYG